jgi:hypothetical protein
VEFDHELDLAMTGVDNFWGMPNRTARGRATLDARLAFKTGNV